MLRLLPLPQRLLFLRVRKFRFITTMTTPLAAIVFRIRSKETGRTLPPLLSREALVEQSEHLGHVELDVFKVELVLAVLLHLEQVVELEVEFEEAAVAS